MWTYRQETGVFEDFKGMPFTGSYAGKGEGKNNPILQDVHGGCRLQSGAWVPVDGLSLNDWGPLPCGIYTMQEPVDDPKHGKYVIWFTPGKGNEMFGRSAFGWHGVNPEHPEDSSEGCICSPHALRVTGWTSGDHNLQVIP